MPSDTPEDRPVTLLNRVFGIEKGEAVAVAWSFAYFFCVLSSYYMMRPMREAMGVESGTETIPILFTSTFFVMLLAAPIFGWVASRYARRQFLPWVYYFFAANVLIFYGVFTFAIDNDLPIVWIGRVFFVWISVFNLFVVSVFWSFMADIYSKKQGRRLFGVISAGGSLGAILGPYSTARFVDQIGFHNMLPFAAALLLIAVFCIYRLRDWVAAEHVDDIAETAAGGKPLGGSAFGGIGHVARSNYLRAITVASIIASLLGTALYMLMNQLVSDNVEGVDARTELFGYIDFASNALTFVFQLLLVKHSVSRFGVGITIAIMPLLSIVGFVVLAYEPALNYVTATVISPILTNLGVSASLLVPALIFIAVLTGLRRAVGFGFTKPANDMLYSVVTPDEKYKAKNFIDTAVYRAGDLIGTWSVRAVLSTGISVISALLVPFAMIWVAIAVWLGREYRRLDARGQAGEKT